MSKETGFKGFKRRYSPLKPMSDLARRIVHPLVQKSGSVLERLQLDWPHIGREFARDLYPISLNIHGYKQDKRAKIILSSSSPHMIATFPYIRQDLEAILSPYLSPVRIDSLRLVIDYKLSTRAGKANPLEKMKDLDAALDSLGKAINGVE